MKLLEETTSFWGEKNREEWGFDKEEEIKSFDAEEIRVFCWVELGGFWVKPELRNRVTIEAPERSRVLAAMFGKDSERAREKEKLHWSWDWVGNGPGDGFISWKT